MLRSFVASSNFRALTTQPFKHGGDACVLGRRTIIYGRNGSGKTTFSELLRLASNGGDSEGVSVSASVRHGGSKSNIQIGHRDFPWTIFVYNRYYVQESLSLFLDGSGGSPTILKLGASNVAGARELEAVRAYLVTLSGRRQAVASSKRSLMVERDATEREVKSEVIAALNGSDPERYNPTRFQVTRAKALLHDESAVELSADELSQELEIAASPIVKPVADLESWPALAAEMRDTINRELLGAAVESQPIPRLADSTTLANWVETGLTLHQAGDVCGFCQQGTVTAETLTEYAQHFSEALDALRERLKRAISYLTSTRDRSETWIANLPEPDSLLTVHRAGILAQVELLKGQDTARRTQLDEAVALLEARLADPLKPLPPEQHVASDFVIVDTAELERLIAEHNSACNKQAERKGQAQEAVEKHYGAVSATSYARTQARIARADRATAALDRREGVFGERAVELEQAQEDTGRMALEIDSDLREHFGHGHLKISVSDDGKGYVVRRGSAVAKSLSEGERNAIAFSYFLRSLEAEGVDPGQAIVVIDDPVTSMDKESLFAGFALAEERTKTFAQVIVLTHDYEYFRLQLRERANARMKSEQKIRANDVNEIAFPSVSVLEILSSVDAGSSTRTSSLRKLPPGLLRHPSEYHYLFFKVAEAVRDVDHETLPLLGNAARRLLEGFISFRAPSGDNFQQKVDQIKAAQSIDDVLARRVVKFLHGQSHREEPRPTSALDFPSVETELHASLDFMRRADASHFSQMCKAVEIDEATLSVAVDSSANAI